MDQKVIIVGAGVAGLIAAKHLEEVGIKPIVVEAADRVGGRVKTTEKDGFLLDHGFQVLLSAYEEAQWYLDYKQLNLKAFNTGAIIKDGENTYQVADPLRDPSKLLPMAFSPVGNLKDKYLTWYLTQDLKRLSQEEVFSKTSNTTEAYLKEYGFSKKIIERFFRPFFGGIFLENDLRTGSGMFRFVFKKFSEGKATIPADGIEAIPKHLQSQLKQTQFHFNSFVEQVQGNQLTLKGGEKLDFDRLIITTDPSKIMPNLAGQDLDHVSTTTLYYTSTTSILNEKSIALVSDAQSLINNFCVLTDVAPSYSKDGRSLISVTLKDKAQQEDNIEEKVLEELKRLSPDEKDINFLHRMDIPYALPVIEDMKFNLQFTEFTLTNEIYLAGDYLLNASLDAAMRSGRNAATAVWQSLG